MQNSIYSQIVIYSKIGGVSQGDAHVRIDTQIKFLYYPLIVTGDNSDAVIDLGYEKNFHNGLVITIMRACVYPLFPLYLRNLLFPWLLMKMLLTIFLKIPHNVIEVMVVLMELLLALKLVEGGVHYTCGGVHDIVCSPHFNGPPNKFFERGEA